MLNMFHAGTVREKLARILLGTTALALMIAAVALVLFDLGNERSRAEQDLITHADVVGLAAEAPLSFSDPRTGAETLRVLRGKPGVIAAALYDANGRLFASYLPDARARLAATVPAEGVYFDWRTAHAVRPVVAHQETLGHVYVQVRHDVLLRAAEYIGWLTIIMVASLAAALMLVNRLQRALVEPIVDVSRVAHAVLREGSYDRRATKVADDEVGDLVDAFNSMLEELGRRARTLEAANAALRTSEARYQLAASGSSAGLWDWDLEAGTMYYSPRLKALLGYTHQEFPDLPASIDHVMHPDDRPAVREALRAHLSADRPYQVECRLRRKDGGWLWFLVTGMAQKDADGRPFRMAGSLVDVSERKQAELVLQESNRAKDQFLATLAHELRNPLAPLRTGVEILKQAGAASPSGKRTLETMERQLVHMVRLIDDLLDISRINSGKIRLSPSRVSLRSAVETAVELSRPSLDAAGHQFTMEMPPQDIELQADATRIAQAIGNLLNNAAKYTPPGGHVHLRVWQEGATAHVRVTDDGVGIPAEMLEHVFALFTQVSRSVDQAHGGLGIGLYLVRHLVRLHGGEVTAHSDGPGRGSTFTISLPCLPVQTPPPAEDRPATAASEPNIRRVLVVDDNVDAAETLASLLDMLGLETRVVHDGPAVRPAVEAFGPELVLLDIGLPGMSGYEVARQLRQDGRFAGIRIVALTGWGADADRERARTAGFDHHLTKPVAIADLEQLVGLAGSSAR